MGERSSCGQQAQGGEDLGDSAWWPGFKSLGGTPVSVGRRALVGAGVRRQAGSSGCMTTPVSSKSLVTALKPPPRRGCRVMAWATGWRSVTKIRSVPGSTRSTETPAIGEYISRSRLTRIKSSDNKFWPGRTMAQRRMTAGAITPSVRTSTRWMAKAGFSYTASSRNHCPPRQKSRANKARATTPASPSPGRAPARHAHLPRAQLDVEHELALAEAAVAIGMEPAEHFIFGEIVAAPDQSCAGKVGRNSARRRRRLRAAGSTPSGRAAC